MKVGTRGFMLVDARYCWFAAMPLRMMRADQLTWRDWIGVMRPLAKAPHVNVFESLQSEKTSEPGDGEYFDYMMIGAPELVQIRQRRRLEEIHRYVQERQPTIVVERIGAELVIVDGLHRASAAFAIDPNAYVSPVLKLGPGLPAFWRREYRRP